MKAQSPHVGSLAFDDGDALRGVELLTAAQAGVMLGLSRWTLYKWRGSGRMPNPVRIGGAVRWRREELLSWIDAGCPLCHEWVWGMGS